MKFKKLFVAVIAILLVFVAFGCGQKKSLPNFDVPESGYDGSAVTIKFSHTMGQNLQDELKAAIAEFNAIYPNITVEHSQVGSYNDVRDQTITEISGGNQPNIAYCYPDHVALYNKAKAVVELDALIASDISDGNGGILGLTDEQINDFIPGYYNEGRCFGNDHMYTLPFSKSTEVLYYNKTVFDSLGLSVPDHWFSNGDSDTTSMEYVCRKLKEKYPNSTPLGVDSSSNWFITMCEQLKTPYTSATGDHFLFNNDQNRKFVSDFASWYKDGLVTTQTLYGSYTSGLFVLYDNKLTDAEQTCSFMSIGSSAGASHQVPGTTDNNGVQEYAFLLDIATIPQADQNNKKVISQGPSVCIFKKSNPQEVLASWLFVKYLTTNVEFQAGFSIESGYVPVIKSVANNEYYQKHLADAANISLVSPKSAFTSLSAKVCLEQADYYYVSPAFIGSSTARDQVGDIIDAAFTYVQEGSTGQTLTDRITTKFKEAISECEYNS